MTTDCEDRADWDEEYGALVTSGECPPPPPSTTGSVPPLWMTLEVAYSEGWNLVGLPLEVESSYYADLFPTAVAGTLYGFNGTYDQEAELIPGKGYWLVFDEAGTQNITGIAINELTISLNVGWQLISGISFPTDVNDIIDPEGIIIPGSVYGFSGLYENTTVLYPGKGYWINTEAADDITIVHTASRNWIDNM